MIQELGVVHATLCDALVVWEWPPFWVPLLLEKRVID
jgi:hypothetical protein